MPVIIKEIRIDPKGEWRALKHFLFIHMQRNLTEVSHSRAHVQRNLTEVGHSPKKVEVRIADELDVAELSKSWWTLQATAQAHLDPTLTYYDLYSNASAVQRVAATIGLSAADISKTLPL